MTATIRKYLSSPHCNFCGARLRSNGMAYKGHEGNVKHICSDCYHKCQELYNHNTSLYRVNNLTYR